ncbi:MAG: phosphoserine phosphatase SerB [Pikeienuella sp.]
MTRGFVAVLTGAPGRALVQAEVDTVARALPEADGARWLAPEAAEISCAARPGPEALPHLPGVDLNILPAEGREKRLLLADMDSTMIGCECIDELAAAAGIKAEVAAITERTMSGDLDFEDSLRARVALLEGVPQTALAEVYDASVRLNPGARLLVRTMASRGAHTALVSGGFSFFTERVAAAAGFAEHRANILLFEEGRLVGRVAEPVLGRSAKAEILTELAQQVGCVPAEAVAVGDGANDIAMVAAVGLGVGYRPKPALAEVADAVLQHADLSAVLHLQGIPTAAFVRD